MRTREEILLSMVENMPYELSSNTKPYLMEAMEIYAKEYHENELKKLRVSNVLKNELEVCDLCDEDGWIHENKGDIIEHRLCECNK